MIARYFIHNDKRYEYGTIVKIKIYNNVTNLTEDKCMTFIGYNIERSLYIFKINDKKCKNRYRLITYKKEIFNEILIEITNCLDYEYIRYNQNKISHKSKLTLIEELKVEGMLLAWVWYVFLMGITLFFNGFIFYWGIFTIVFVTYRNKKLREEGYDI